MAENRLALLATRAKNGELTNADINEIVIALADNEQRQDANIKRLEVADRQKGRELTDIREEYPLLPPESDDLSRIVRKKGVEVMGGKRSPAYNNADLRKRVYRDIYGEIKRQYGLEDERGRQQSYKKLKRKYLTGAIALVKDYVLPIALANEIEAENEAGDEE